MEQYQEQKFGNFDVYGSQVAMNGGTIKKSKNKNRETTEQDGRITVSSKVYWGAAVSGFLGGVIASLVATIIAHCLNL